MEKDEKYLTKAMKSVRDFTVKLSKVYKKDFYIVNGTYIYPGIQSESELSGLIICEIEEPYKEYLKDLGITNSQLVYVSDIKTFKDDIISPKSNIENESKLTELLDIISSFTNKVKTSYKIWNKFEVDDDIFFNEKEIVELNSNNENIPSVIIGLKMLPLISEKNKNDLYYVCDIEDAKMTISLFFILFDFHTPHFRIMMKYNYVSPVV